ncbi:MAG: helicase-exonuclease AddAB subunit AddB [Clostridia bacterium]|nr:helicase-exonuclease AddAB subunit AddB [Clostridia bacterium]
MSLKFWIGGSGAGKSHDLYQYVIEQSQKNPATNYIVIVPEQFTLQTQRDLVLAHPRKGIMNIDVLSFARLAYRIFDETGDENSQRMVIDDMGKSLVLRRIATQKSDELSVLGKNLKKLGYINEVKSVISEFMQYSIKEHELEKLMEYAKNRPMLQYKLKDISILYRAFLEEMQGTYTTKEELLEILCRVIDQSRMVRNCVFVFDGFTGFTPVQNQLLQKLMVLAKEIHVTVLLRTAEQIDQEQEEQKKIQEQMLFYMSEKTISTLAKMVNDLNVPLQAPFRYLSTPVYRLKDNPALAFLEEHIFRNTAETFLEEQDAVHILCAKNPEEEMKQICIEISKALRNNPDLHYGDIAVITGDTQLYAHTAEQEFTLYDIPYFMDQTRGILLNPLVEYLRALIEIIVMDYNYEGIFRYLKSSLSDFGQEDIDQLENYVLAFGIHGRKQWSHPWLRKSRHMQAEELVRMNELREQVTMQFECYEHGMREAECAKDYVQVIYEMITSQNMEQKAHAMAEGFEAAGKMETAKEYHQIYRMIMDLLDQICELLPDEQMSVKEFGELLDAGFDEIRVGVTPPSIDEVMIGDITRTRLKDIKLLFFAGVNEGIVPKGNSVSGIISDLDRELLSEQEIELAPSRRQQAYKQRVYLYMIMTKPNQQLYLSYSLASEEGQALQPSYLIREIQKLYPNIEIKRPSFDAGSALSERLMTPKSALGELAACLREQLNPEYEALFSWYLSDENYKKQVLLYVEAAFLPQKTDPISKAVAQVLYGKVLTNSVTRLEKYAACAYSHFLQYGLLLKERELYSFEASDLGTVFHETLKLYSGLLEKSPYTWFDIPEDAENELLRQSVEASMKTADILYSTARYQYLIHRITRIMERTVHMLTKQVRKGLFKPNNFEFSFATQTDFHSLNIRLSEEEEMHLAGRIDRVDTYEDKDKVYVKIIDYKSGNKSFDMAAIYYGLELQLVVYMNAAIEMQQKEHPDKEIIPAGVLYYHIDDPIIDTPKQLSDEEIEEQIQKELVMRGLVNSDQDILAMIDQEFQDSSTVIPVSKTSKGEFSKSSSIATTEQFYLLSNFVNQKIAEMGSQILSGRIEQNPCVTQKQDACTYCDFHSICQFDEREQSAEKRQLDKLSAENALAGMNMSLHKKSDGEEV